MAKSNAFINKCKTMSEVDAKRFSNSLRFFAETEADEVENDGVTIKKTDTPHQFEAHDSEDNSVTRITQDPDSGTMQLKDETKEMSVTDDPDKKEKEKEATVFKVVDEEAKPEVKTEEPKLEEPKLEESSEVKDQVKQFSKWMRGRGMTHYTANDIRHYAIEKNLSTKLFSELEAIATTEAKEEKAENVQEALKTLPDGPSAKNDSPIVKGTTSPSAAVEEAKTFSSWRKAKNYSEEAPVTQDQIDEWADETNPSTKEYKEMCKKYSEEEGKVEEVKPEEEKVEEAKPEEDEFKEESENKVFSLYPSGNNEIDRVMNMMSVGKINNQN